MTNAIIQTTMDESTIELIFNQLFTVGCFAAITSIILFSVVLKLQHQYKLGQYQTRAKTTFRQRRRGM